ncbi:hypothetical protein M0813_27322 [Anaeramoeba flamelloides]|uniref:Uncharacterized protein n=1 Tax=Anaeramoeba flamelloides TaxID=1746091 RepID=A0ABQ8XW66_9EUKA|nr:hypothetical protein M0813_27322 [Anaeramoeba flamelloides]
MISYSVELLSKTEDFDQVLLTTFHIKWFLEFLGPVFSFPMKESTLIERSLDIYEKLICGERVSQAFLLKRNLFLVDIFGHLSLLFHPRKQATEIEMEKHIFLCKKALDIFELLEKKEPDYVDKKTWIKILNITLGLTDNLFNDSSNSKLIGNPNELNNPKLYYHSMNLMKSVIKLFLQLKEPEKLNKSKNIVKIVQRAEGNSILTLFGDWIFEACSKNDPSFSDGISIAYSSLCEIFLAPQKEKFKEAYINEFFTLIIISFKNYELLNYSEELPFKATIPVYQIRKSALLILKTLVCIPNYFSLLKLEILDQNSQDIVSNGEFFEILRTSISSAFLSEQNSDNIIILLQIMCYVIFETINQKSKLVPLFILTITKFISRPTPMQLNWSVEAFLMGISILRSLSCLVEQLDQTYTQPLKNTVLAFSRSIRNYLEFHQKKIKQEDFKQIIFGILNVICDFIVPSQWIYAYPRVLSEVFHMLYFLIDENEDDENEEIQKTFEKNEESPKKTKEKKKERLIIPKEIKFKALIVFLKISRFTGNFPLKSGPTQMSNQLTEKILKKKLNLSEKEFLQCSRFFIFNQEQLITVVEDSSKKNGKAPKIYFIIRNLQSYLQQRLINTTNFNMEQFQLANLAIKKPNDNYESTKQKKFYLSKVIVIEFRIAFMFGQIKLNH